MNKQQKDFFEKNGYFIADPSLTDWRWVGFHKKFIIEKLNAGKRKISLAENTEYEIKFNPFITKFCLYVKDKCKQLLPDGKCKIYRARPKICGIAKCVVFDNEPKVRWFGLNGLLKEEREQYENGELSKWK